MRGRLGTRCASPDREVSPAISDSSGLTVLSRSPSPPSTGRQLSPAPSDSSELSMLSRSPSPPPGLFEKIEISPRSNLPTRRSNGRFMRSDAKCEASPTPSARPAKRLRVLSLNTPKIATKKTPAKSRSPRTPRSSRSPRSSVALKAAVLTPEAKGAGQLDRLPKEIRQEIYAYCLDIDDPVLLKECCGPTSTRRARDSCKKHGEHCSKIGRGNGLTLYEEDEGSTKVYGRFSILSVARSCHDEASWVLHNQGKLIIRSTKALQAYLSGKDCTFFRLPNLPGTECVECMWLSAGRFRKICFELPWTKFSIEDPIECVYRLYEAIAFLMKAWDLVKEKPTSPRTVELQLQALHTAIVPTSHIWAVVTLRTSNGLVRRLFMFSNAWWIWWGVMVVGLGGKSLHKLLASTTREELRTTAIPRRTRRTEALPDCIRLKLVAVRMASNLWPQPKHRAISFLDKKTANSLRFQNVFILNTSPCAALLTLTQPATTLRTPHFV